MIIYIPNHLLKEATSDKPLSCAESQVKTNGKIEMLGDGARTPINTKGIFQLRSSFNSKDYPQQLK